MIQNHSVPAGFENDCRLMSTAPGLPRAQAACGSYDINLGYYVTSSKQTNN